ncbi:methyl-accepting chemotaxis protein [Clostridium botulinum]|uniref:methyl-accepting chemotaxis protein n=1 Tax=Clostridium botulinum TaxID=1491 RepID=UPI00069B7153|nr:methyl-accepting chemotaxis protein [Clostridium botulinum]KOA94567.1 chemotaxis protein [Clostridium botulinum]MCD3202679.1 HAMP domain-containing protein [Clostridium botulinum C/D]MCD3223112.1 HAMP domain-containing protein [Clostridium botulinum C/D]MCD3229736.1 HAMP domain-containing protein [Clostridium botulinum C/D]MCD3273886.1 HAMP domain-containing protein [Clostridium botulinum C/D]
MFNSLRGKIMWSFVAVTLGAMIIFTYISTECVNAALERQMSSVGKMVANTVLNAINDIPFDKGDKINQELSTIKNGSGGELRYIVLVKKDKSVVGSSELGKDVEYKDKNNIVDKALSGTRVNQIYKNETGEEICNVSLPICEDNSDTVVAVMSMGISLANSQHRVKNAVKVFSILTLIILGIVIVVSRIISKNIVKPINKMSREMKNVVNGDFTIHFSPKGNDEVADLMHSLNYVMDTLREIIGKVQEVSLNLNEMASNLSDSSEEVASSGEDAIQNVDQIVNMTNNQAEIISETTESIEHFSDNIDIIHDRIEKVLTSNNVIKGSAEDGENQLNSLIQVVDDMKKSFENSSDKIEFLTNNIGEITKVMDVINAVAKQTNLLALNAAIEASRAGESGKGFAVVAEEIRKLAEQVLESSSSINDLVDTIMINTRDVSETTNLVSNKVKTEMDVLDDTVTSFKSILNEIENATPYIDNVYKAIEKLVNAKDKILEKVETINSNSQELSANMQEISNSIEEQEASVEEISSSSQELLAISSEFTQKVSKFKVN